VGPSGRYSPRGPIWALRCLQGPPGAYSIQVIYSHIWTDRLNFVILRARAKIGHIPTGQKISTGTRYQKKHFSPLRKKFPRIIRLSYGIFK